MLHAGLDLSRRKIDVCLLGEQGGTSTSSPSPPDVDSLRTLATNRRGRTRAGLRRGRVDDRRPARPRHAEQEGWDVEIADAQKVKGLAPLACKTDKIDSLVLAMLRHRDLVPAIWLPDPRVREERELARFRMHLVKHKSALKNRIHSTLINFGTPARSPICSGPRAAGCSPARRPRAVALERRGSRRADRSPRGRDRP